MGLYSILCVIMTLEKNGRRLDAKMWVSMEEEYFGGDLCNLKLRDFMCSDKREGFNSVANMDRGSGRADYRIGGVKRNAATAASLSLLILLVKSSAKDLDRFLGFRQV